jgi:hypothetical protein
MNISKEDLDWAASQKLLSPEQAKLLWTRLEERRPERSNFGVANLAYYRYRGPPNTRGLRLLGLFARLDGFLGRPVAHAE